MQPKLTDLIQESKISTSRSSGPGGQHVNKTETKVELRFNVAHSAILTPDQKHLIVTKLSHFLVENGTTIMIQVQTTRSQLKNKEIAYQKLLELILKSLKTDVQRIPTKPTKSSKKKRRLSKAILAQKKALRGNLNRNNFD